MTRNFEPFFRVKEPYNDSYYKTTLDRYVLNNMIDIGDFGLPVDIRVRSEDDLVSIKLYLVDDPPKAGAFFISGFPRTLADPCESLLPPL